MRPKNSQKMPDKLLIILLVLLFITTGGGAGHTQTPPQDMPPDPSANEPVPHPELPQKTSTVIIDNDRLSVEFVDANFLDIILSIARKAGFALEGTSNAFSKKVTTKFNDLDLETGLMRLFSLVSESNYRIDYNENGTISKLTLIGDKMTRSPATTSPVRSRSVITSAPAAPAAGFRPVAQPPRSSRVNRLRQVPQAPATPQPLQSPVPQEPEPTPDAVTPDASLVPEEPETGHVEDNTGDEQAQGQEVNEIPYNPPQKKPVYIPALTR